MSNSLLIQCDFTEAITNAKPRLTNMTHDSSLSVGNKTSIYIPITLRNVEPLCNMINYLINQYTLRVSTASVHIRTFMLELSVHNSDYQLIAKQFQILLKDYYSFILQKQITYIDTIIKLIL